VHYNGTKDGVYLIGNTSKAWAFLRDAYRWYYKLEKIFFLVHESVMAMPSHISWILRILRPDRPYGRYDALWAKYRILTK